jgi:ribonuclease G
MFKEILVKTGEEENKVAVLEDRLLMEIYFERSVNKRLVGNIYKGRVENVLPGMQAAFVDIGLDKNAFLYIEDALPVRNGEDNGRNNSQINIHIDDILRKGQELLVQLAKEPIGTKGPRVTTHITLPGRYLVLMPGVEYIGISRRIDSEKERERLKKLASLVQPEGMGLIVRTVAEGVDEEAFRQDVGVIKELWRKALVKASRGPAPCLVHRDLALVQRILRDIFTEDVHRLTLDSATEYHRVLDMLDLTGPYLKGKVFLEDEKDLFYEYGVELETDKALKRKVWLKSGGYLVIDQAEALTVIDVNTGKYVGTTKLEDTVLKTNLEAVREITRQLRLRNIGGIIIVDFIDMLKEDHRQAVLQALEMEIKKDKTKINIFGLTQLGLVEMTRKKVHASLSEVLQKPCHYCEGKGKILSEDTLSINFKNQIRQVAERSSAGCILVEAHPLMAARVIGVGGATLREREEEINKSLYIRGSVTHYFETVTIEAISSKEEIVEPAQPVKPGDVLYVRIEEAHLGNPSDGIARVSGFVLNIEGAGEMTGETTPVEVCQVFRTYAKARLLSNECFG